MLKLLKTKERSLRLCVEKDPAHTTPFSNENQYCFVPDTATVHTTTPKTISENGSLRKRSLVSNDLKTILFENAVFLVRTAKMMLSENDDIITTTRPGCRPLNLEYPRCFTRHEMSCIRVCPASVHDLRTCTVSVVSWMCKDQYTSGVPYTMSVRIGALFAYGYVHGHVLFACLRMVY